MEGLLQRYMAFLDDARVARLATASTGGKPHVIPICYAFTKAAMYSAIDEKPKMAKPSYLKRLRNIAQNPLVAVVIDVYSENWEDLGYLLIQGRAEVLNGSEEHAQAVGLLRRRYPQYEAMPLENRPVIRINPTSVVGWGRAKLS